MHETHNRNIVYLGLVLKELAFGSKYTPFKIAWDINFGVTGLWK